MSINIREAQPTHVIESSWLEEYEQGMNLLWLQELVLLNSNLYILEKLLDFPFDLFVMPDRRTFFRLVQINLFRSCIIIVWKLVEDPDPSALTLLRFKNEVRRHIRPQYASSFDAALKETKFDKQIEQLLEPIRTLRNKRIAHLDKGFNLPPEQIKELRVSLSDLMVLRDTLNQLFEVLCFGCQRSVLPIEYNPEVRHPPGVDARSDIEKFLDNVVKDSPLLNMPENEPDRWPYFREGLPTDALQVLNEYRRKFGLPEV